MTAREWPNKLGWDVGKTAEVMKLEGGALKVHTISRVAIVISTNDPVEAVKLTRKHGHLLAELNDIEIIKADAIVREQCL